MSQRHGKPDRAECPPPAQQKAFLAPDKRLVEARYAIGQVVKHRLYPFRGVVFDVDPEFANSDEWYESIPPAIRPRKDQPFYHLLAENEQSEYVAYVSEQNLLPDDSGEPLRHARIQEMFEPGTQGLLARRSWKQLN